MIKIENVEIFGWQASIIARKSHKLDEWRTFCKWIEQLQLSKLIIGGTEK